jgi:hypothetical protein
MGYSMRTSVYRCTAYYPFNRTTLLPRAGRARRRAARAAL